MLFRGIRIVTMTENITAGRMLVRGLVLGVVFITIFASSSLAQNKEAFAKFTLAYDTATDTKLQADIEGIDRQVRHELGIPEPHTSVGVIDLKTSRLAMIQPDRIEYAASIPKIGILLAFFDLYPGLPSDLKATTRHELGLMVKASKNEIATRFSTEIGLIDIQRIIAAHHFYDEKRGGLWMGKHYGAGSERYGDPLSSHSHAATVRELLRYYLLLEQGKLVSAEASKVMREIFESPDIPHDNIKFVKGLQGRDVKIIRKWGSYKTWQHDTAVITGPDRHFILVALTNHPKGDEYLVHLAPAVDDLLSLRQASK